MKHFLHLATCIFLFSITSELGAEPESWARKPPFAVAGIHKTGSHWVMMPVGALEGAKSYLGENPNQWEVDVNRNFAQLGKTMVTLIDYSEGRRGFAMYYVTTNSWFYLNPAGSVSAINSVLQKTFETSDFGDNAKLKTYLNRVFHLRYPQGGIWDGEFLRNAVDLQPRGLFATENKKYLPRLRRMAYQPQVSSKGSDTTITFDVLLYAGAVQQWILHCKRGRWVELSSIETTVLFPEKTIAYPFVM